MFIPRVPYLFCALLNEKQRGSGTQTASAFFFVNHPFLFAWLVTFIICRRNSFPYSLPLRSSTRMKILPRDARKKTPIKNVGKRRQRLQKAGFAVPNCSTIFKVSLSDHAIDDVKKKNIVLVLFFLSFPSLSLFPFFYTTVFN